MFEDALCVALELPTENFFEDFENPEISNSEKMKTIAICNQCNAQEECREYGRSQYWGLWGGVYMKNGKPVTIRRKGTSAVANRVLKIQRTDKNLSLR